jgi:hypothetical protein
VPLDAGQEFDDDGVWDLVEQQRVALERAEPKRKEAVGDFAPAVSTAANAEHYDRLEREVRLWPPGTRTGTRTTPADRRGSLLGEDEGLSVVTHDAVHGEAPPPDPGVTIALDGVVGHDRPGHRFLTGAGPARRERDDSASDGVDDGAWSGSAHTRCRVTSPYDSGCGPLLRELVPRNGRSLIKEKIFNKR